MILVQYLSGLSKHPSEAMTSFVQKSMCLAILVGSVSGSFPCSDGFTTKSGEPSCATAYGSSCSTATCCIAPKKCSAYQAAWILAQAASGGCQANSNKAFFDNKKTAMTVASPHGEAEITSACCTPMSLAKCSDWAGVYGCASGTSFQKDNAAAPDGADGKTFSSVAKFREKCCITTPKKCSAYTSAWVIAAALNGGCAANSAKNFFDLKKAAVTVASPHGDAEVTAACCTPFSMAKCSDWAGVYGCASGTVLQKDNSGAPDGADGKSFSDVAKFRVKCCAAPPTPPKTCSDYSVAWTAAQLLGSGCAASNAKDFFDRKKLAVTVAAPHGDAQIKAACCTPFSYAKCSDWTGVYGCASGTVLLSTDAAAPDGSDGKSFSSLAKFRQVCCKAPLKCSAYTGTEVSGAIMQAASLWVAGVAVIGMQVL